MTGQPGDGTEMEPMKRSAAESSKPRRRLRWLLGGAFCGLGGLALLVLALPWIIELPPMQRLLASAASRVMAPGTVRFGHLRVFWNRSTEIEDLVLRDAQGDDIVTAPAARFSWSLWQVMVTRPRTSTLSLDRAAVDIERTASGQVDLLETLKPILKDEPDRTLLVRITGGKLRFRAAGLEQPFLADPADIDLDLNAYPEPIAWRLKLERTVDRSPAGRVDVQGSMSRDKESGGLPEDLNLAIRGERWPVVFSNPRLNARCAFSGAIDVRHAGGELRLEGDTHLLDVQAGGPALAGDELHWAEVTAAWIVGRGHGVWSADHLDIGLPVGSLKASGAFPPDRDRGAHVAARLDLAGLARQLPRTLHLRDDLTLEQGSLELQADASGDVDKAGQLIAATARLTDLAARLGSRELSFRDPANFRARLHRQSGRMEVEQLDVQTPFLTAQGRGDLDRGVDVSAVIDLEAASRRLHDWLDLGRIDLAGKGTVQATYQHSSGRYALDASTEFRGLKIAGAPVVETFQRDTIAGKLKAAGPAADSGLPTRLDELSISARSGVDDIRIGASRDASGSLARFEAFARTQLVAAGKKQQVNATMQARWGDAEVTLDPIALVIEPVVGPGGQFLPGEPSRWSGKGTYHLTRDELAITADPQPAGSRPLALAPATIHAGGFKTRDAAWFEARLNGDVAALSRLAKWEQPLDGALAGSVSGRQGGAAGSSPPACRSMTWPG